MIVIGYQGIGKSTSTKWFPGKYIDLESSTFFNNNTWPDDWYIYYCNIAVDLSKQGYVVFVSSHEVVRKQLAKIKGDEYVIGVIPAEFLEETWINKLYERYLENPSDKNNKAYLNAKDRFKLNTNEIRSDCEHYFNGCLIIETLEYNLDGLIMHYKYTNGLLED